MNQRTKEQRERRHRKEQELIKEVKPIFKIGSLVNIIGGPAVFESDSVFRVSEYEYQFYGRMPNLMIGFYCILSNWDVKDRNSSYHKYNQYELVRASYENSVKSQEKMLKRFLEIKYKFIPFDLKCRYIFNVNKTNTQFDKEVGLHLWRKYSGKTLGDKLLYIDKIYTSYYRYNILVNEFVKAKYSHHEKSKFYPLLISLLKKNHKQQDQHHTSWVNQKLLKHLPSCPTEVILEIREDYKKQLLSERQKLEDMEKTFASIIPKRDIKKASKATIEKIITPLESKIDLYDQILKQRTTDPLSVLGSLL